MLRTRLWMGAVLVALTVGVLVVDSRLGHGYPFLFLLLLLLSLAGCVELLGLLEPARRPPAWLCLTGGVAAAVLTAFLLNRLGPVLPDPAAAGFGLTVGGAGVLGDLAESLIKRDCRRKDASQVVPGFGGVLDVVDAVVFAAPVAYC